MAAHASGPCSKYSRGAAQKTIFERLHALASADGISKNEEKPLEWLVHLWPEAKG